ncbi:MAG TPA: TIGR01777 family oxidoreductase [Hanamia sp.]|nr:TIGR01777 family oxidoreductase [Hanamia sp.]
MPVVLISGGTGLIGSHLTNHLIERDFDVIILSRNKNASSENPKISYSYWSVKDKVIDAGVVKKADHIIHLAGAGVIDKKWTNEYKKLIVDSRTKSAELIINCLKENQHHVKTFVSASAIGWYGEDDKSSARKEGFIETDLPSKDFLGETCVLWEASTEPVTELGIRLVKLRTGIVLTNEGGAFKEYRRPLNFGVAPILGNGKQVVSWIHIDDLCRMYAEAIENGYLHGSYNAVAPKPVTQKDLILTLGQKMRNKFFIPIYVPGFILKLIFGKRSIEILKSATVSDKKIKATGFTFLYPSIESAIDELVANPSK